MNLRSSNLSREEVKDTRSVLERPISKSSRFPDQTAPRITKACRRLRIACTAPPIRNRTPIIASATAEVSVLVAARCTVIRHCRYPDRRTGKIHGSYAIAGKGEEKKRKRKEGRGKTTKRGDDRSTGNIKQPFFRYVPSVFHASRFNFSFFLLHVPIRDRYFHR